MGEIAEEFPVVITDDDRCVVPEVELTVPKTDDPSLPVLTFRMWFLGISACIVLSFINQFFWYRTMPLSITGISAQIAVVPLGHLMARVLPSRRFLEGTRFQFTLNPGAFNVKEHVLITIFANSGAGSVYATHILSAIKLYYKRSLPFLPAFLVMITTQILGFGWAGLFRKHLVEPGEMWWPSNLVQVSLFGALHEKEKKSKGHMSRTQFFLIVLVASFAYYILPGYLFTMLTSISWVCWFNPKSILVNQLGSGEHGLGVGSIGFDWVTISAYLGSPLASPLFASVNVAIGFVLVMYIVTPICYWLNIYEAKTFPIFSSQLFMANGSRYDVLSIIDSKFHLDRAVYSNTGSINMSTFFAVTYGLGFATLSATIVHVLVFNGSDLWKQTRGAFQKDKKMDIHTRIMKKNYREVPMWWFLVILLLNIALIMFISVHYNATVQLPWWGVLLACAIAISFTPLIGVIAATTNQAPGLNIITEYVIGYIYPERPVANMCFKVYGYISMTQALTFISDFKLGHYMKIPPRSMFIAQVVGTLVAVMVYTGTAWWLMEEIPHLCDTTLLPSDSQWTCPMDRVFFDASVIWGLVGPRRVFGDLGEYSSVNWFFLVGAIAPLLVWLAAKAFPAQTWISKIHIPVLVGATAMMPPATAVNFTSWLIVAFVFGHFIFKYRREWWKKYNYVLSGWYLLRARRRHFRRRSRNRRSTMVFFAADPSAAAVASRGLDPAVIKSLPVFAFSESTHKDLTECAVCLSEFEEGESGRVLPGCKHTFHVDCIDMWFHSHSTCPLCRSLVEPPVEEQVAITISPEPVSVAIEPGSSSGLRKPAAIEVPRRNFSEFDDRNSPANHSFRSPMSRMLSFTRMLSRGNASSPIAGAPPQSPSSNCRIAMTESDIERGGEETR